MFDRGHAPGAVGEFEPAITADVGGAIEVDVHVDEAREQNLVAEVDTFDARYPMQHSRVGDIRDAAIVDDEERGKIARPSGWDIAHARVADDGLAGRSLRLCGDTKGSANRYQ